MRLWHAMGNSRGGSLLHTWFDRRHRHRFGNTQRTRGRTVQWSVDIPNSHGLLQIQSKARNLDARFNRTRQHGLGNIQQAR